MCAQTVSAGVIFARKSMPDDGIISAPPRGAPYEIVFSPRSGYGIEAFCDLEKDAVILRERPLVCLSSEALQKAAMSDTQMQALLMALADEPDPFSEECWWPERVPTPIKAIQRFAEIVFAKCAPSTQQKWMSLADSFSSPSEAKSPGNVIRSNAFTDADTGDNYLYEHLSRANHSCDPNLMRTFAAQGLVVVSTLRRVRTGEALHISYLSDEDLALPTDERRALLRTRFNFDCACSRCEPSSTAAKRSEASCAMDAGTRADGAPSFKLSLGCDAETSIRPNVSEATLEDLSQTPNEYLEAIDASQRALSHHHDACTSQLIATGPSSSPLRSELLESIGACSAALARTTRARQALNSAR